MSPKSVRFFTVHAEADEEHGALAEEIVIRYITPPHLQQQTRAATLRRMELLSDLSTFGNAFYGLGREKCPIGGGFQVHTAYGKTRFIVQENK